MGELLERITSNRKILQGAAIIRDQPLSVESVLGQIAAGATYETLKAQHPWLEPEDLQACLLFAQQAVQSAKPELTDKRMLAKIPEIVGQIPYLKLLVLFGSRARGDSHFQSDWDFAVLFDENLRKQYEQGSFSPYRSRGILQDCLDLSDDQIDVVELNRCDELLLHRIAQDGKLLYEQDKGEFDGFKRKHIKNPEQLKQWRAETNKKIVENLQSLQQ